GRRIVLLRAGAPLPPRTPLAYHLAGHHGKDAAEPGCPGLSRRGSRWWSTTRGETFHVDHTRPVRNPARQARLGPPPHAPAGARRGRFLIAAALGDPRRLRPAGRLRVQPSADRSRYPVRALGWARQFRRPLRLDPAGNALARPGRTCGRHRGE